MDLAHYFAAGAQIINPSRMGDSWARPPEKPWLAASLAERLGEVVPESPHLPAMYLLEIPSDFQALREDDVDLALSWRLHVRTLLEDLFERGYIITDFVHLSGENPRSFYVLSHGEKTLGG